jgi:hypothetical protein
LPPLKRDNSTANFERAFASDICVSLNLIVISIRHSPPGAATPIIPYPDFKLSERLPDIPAG